MDLIAESKLETAVATSLYKSAVSQKWPSIKHNKNSYGINNNIVSDRGENIFIENDFMCLFDKYNSDGNKKFLLRL